MRGFLLTFFWLPNILAAQMPTDGQGEAVRFTSEARMVVEIVTVLDKNGTPIEGLTARDFAITENGVPQQVAVCEFQRFDDSPLSSVPGAGEQQASSEPTGPQRYQGRRLLALYFDRSAMPASDQFRAYTAAARFVRTQMTRADLVSILAFSHGRLRVLENFTADHEKLLDALGRLVARDEQFEEGSDSAFGQDDDEFNVFTTDRQLSALQNAARMLERIRERKSIVYFASGARFASQQNMAQMRALVNAASRANCRIFTVDARGLVALPPMGDAAQASPGGAGMYTGETATALADSFERSQDALYALAADTGGRTLLNQNDLSAGIVQAQKADANHYVIGYYSSNAARDGKFRRITIALREHPSARLDYRQGYFGEKEFGKFTAADKERQLEEALMLENPITDLPIALAVNYFQLNDAEYYVPVMINIPGSEFARSRKGAGEHAQIDVIGEIKDSSGRTVQNLRDKVDLKLSGTTLAGRFSRGIIEYDTAYTLLPGAYSIKVLARDSKTGRIGTYLTPFVIPNLNKVEHHVPISSIILSSERVKMSNALHTVGKDKEQANNPLVQNGHKLVPSVTRVFWKNRPFFVYLQAYQPKATASQPIVAYVSLFRAGEKAFETAPVEFTASLTNRLRTTPLTFAIPLERLEPGRYDCQVTVIDWGSGIASFRQAPLYVAP